MGFPSTWSYGETERTELVKICTVTYCNIGRVVVEHSGDVLIRESPGGVTYQQTSLPHSSVPHHHTLNSEHRNISNCRDLLPLLTLIDCILRNICLQ